MMDVTRFSFVLVFHSDALRVFAEKSTQPTGRTAGLPLAPVYQDAHVPGEPGAEGSAAAWSGGGGVSGQVPADEHPVPVL